MSEHKDVSVTASIVNESRARLESLSGDIYAKLWVTERAKELWGELAREVYPYDDINLSLRNRFYLNRTRNYIIEHNDSVFVNMAAGFTSYPYLIDIPCSCIETDYPHIMNFKEKKVRQWQQDGTLPKRSVEYYPFDMENHDELNNFEEVFASWCADSPAILIMEGLTYYLSSGTLDVLFSYFAEYLVEGSLVVFDFWGPDSDGYPVIQRVKKYLSKVSGGPPPKFTYMNFDHIRNIKEFSVVEHTDIAELERRFTHTHVLQEKTGRFPTEFVVLRKD